MDNPKRAFLLWSKVMKSEEEKQKILIKDWIHWTFLSK